MDTLNLIFDTLADALKSILPLCPFEDFITSISVSPYVGYMNYFIPIGKFIDILTAWVTAIVNYYGVMIALRWAQIIE